MVEIKNLTEKDIPQVIQLSLTIFTPPKMDEDRFHKQTVWEDYLKENGLLLGAFVDDELDGYVFFYDREKDSKSSHCWLAGVAEKFRGMGLWKMLMEEAQNQLKAKGYKQITINTYPDNFPVMFNYLTKYNYEMYKEEEKEWHGTLSRKCFFRKQL